MRGEAGPPTQVVVPLGLKHGRSGDHQGPWEDHLREVAAGGPVLEGPVKRPVRRRKDSGTRASREEAGHSPSGFPLQWAPQDPLGRELRTHGGAFSSSLG